jgi:hypothetical protein
MSTFPDRLQREIKAGFHRLPTMLKNLGRRLASRGHIIKQKAAHSALGPEPPQWIEIVEGS